MEWNKIRLAMLTGSKYAAMLNNYSSNHAQTIQQMQSMAAIDLFEFSFRKKSIAIETSDVDDKTKKGQLEILAKLKSQSFPKAFVFENGDTRFRIFSFFFEFLKNCLKNSLNSCVNTAEKISKMFLLNIVSRF